MKKQDNIADAGPGTAGGRIAGTLAAPLIFAVFCLTLTPWRYNFPLNDDWAYAIGARNLLEHGRFILSDWAASTQLPHLLFGALFAKIFGFSFNVLRAYTLTAAAGTVLLFVMILEELGIKPFNRAFAGLVLALNPLFLILADSFMTDMTYLFWMTAASYLYIRHLKTAKPAALIGAGVCAAAACLTRQLGIALPLAFTLVLALEKKLDRRSITAVWLVPLAAIAGYALWFKYVHGPTWTSENYVFSATLKYMASPGAFAKNTIYRLFAVTMETGLVLLPAAAACYFAGMPDRQKNKNAPRRAPKPFAMTPGAWLTLAALAGFALLNGPLPYLENTFSSSGLGVMTLGGAALKPSAFFSNTYFWYAFTALAAVSAAVLLRASILSLKTEGSAAKFVFASAILHLGISLSGAKFFDRYLLTLLPWFILAAVLAARDLKLSKPAAGLALALMAAVSWAGVKDYMQWNLAKWELAARPRPGLDPAEIVNGFDYDAWFNYEKNMAYLKTVKPLKLIGEWEWQKITPYKAMISFAQNGDLATIDKQEYATPLSSRKGVIYLLQAKER